jgi:hypothetical protein
LPEIPLSGRQVLTHHLLGNSPGKGLTFGVHGRSVAGSAPVAACSCESPLAPLVIPESHLIAAAGFPPMSHHPFARSRPPPNNFPERGQQRGLGIQICGPRGRNATGEAREADGRSRKTQKTMTAALAPYIRRRLSDLTKMSPSLPVRDTGSSEAPDLEKRRLNSENSPPYSPSSRVLHKERYSLSTAVNANNPLRSSSPTTAIVAPPDSANDFICLCTPKPKIPRPRNGESLGVSRLLCVRLSPSPSAHFAAAPTS